MIRAFLFDIGNVLLRFDFAHALTRLQAHCAPIDEARLAVLEPIKREYESGRIDRGEFQRQMRVALSYTGSDAEFLAAWREIFTENEPMTAVVRQLHGRYPLYLLSNTSDLHLEYVRESYPVFGWFEGGVYSHLARAFKPEREIYETVIRELPIEPASTLFIDDLPQNIAAARELGFQAWQYDWREHGAFVAELERRGISFASAAAQT